MIDREALRRLREAAQAATPGPWQGIAERIHSRDEAKARLVGLVDGTAEVGPYLYLLSDGRLCPALTGCGPTSEANAVYLAAADPSTVLALLSALEAAERERDAALKRAEKAERWALRAAHHQERMLIGNQAAVIAAERDGPQAGMDWIANGLDGPGLLPTEADIAEGAQAYYDRCVAELDRAALAQAKEGDRG